MSKVFVATRLDRETHEGLKRIAQQQDRTVGYLLRKAAEQFVQMADKGRKPARTTGG